MTKQELVSKVTEVLKNNNVTKPVSVPNTSFYVCDENDNRKKFTISVPDRNVSYNKKDVGRVIDAVLAVLEDTIQNGGFINIYGVGTIGVKKRAARMVRIPLTDNFQHVPEHYAPYVEFGNIIKRAAKIYNLNMNEGMVDIPDPIYDACESEDEL